MSTTTTTDEIKKRKGYPCGAQKLRLVEILKADPELRQGKFSANFTKKEAEKRWSIISDELNCIPGAKKSWQEWRKTWQDLKHKAKKKETEIRQVLRKTGGGSPPNSLTAEEEIILSTLQESALVGHTDSSESIVNFRDFPTTSTASCISEVIDVDAIDVDFKSCSSIAPDVSEVTFDAVNIDHAYHKGKEFKENTKTKIFKRKKTSA